MGLVASGSSSLAMKKSALLDWRLAHLVLPPTRASIRLAIDSQAVSLAIDSQAVSLAITESRVTTSLEFWFPGFQFPGFRKNI